MKTYKLLLLMAGLLLFCIDSQAQMQINKPIQLTGGGSNAKIEGVEEISNNNDAANKIYVDTAIANRTGAQMPNGQNTGDMLYWDGSSWINIAAGTGGQVLTSQGTNTAPQWNNGGGFTHYVGELYGGGIVFYVYKDAGGNEHGLIASLDDIGTSAWSNVTTTQIGAAAQSAWDGQSNTNAIISQSGHSASAAKMCNDATLNGYSDWYLPAIGELNLLYDNRFLINKVLDNDGNPATNGPGIEPRWSSTEYEFDGSNAKSFLFDALDTYSASKSTNYFSVRAVRAF